jgi:hypothetical protein
LLHSHLFLHDQLTFADISGTDKNSAYRLLCFSLEREPLRGVRIAQKSYFEQKWLSLR